jgi:endonuclease/exonuclease/phosphatase family metal-dependent hydrolase
MKEWRLGINNLRISLRVMTFNIHNGIDWSGKYDLDGTIDFIEEVQPDLAGIQEVSRCWSPKTGFENMEATFAEKLRMNTYFSAAFKRGKKALFGNLVLSKRPFINRWTERLPGNLEPRNFIAVQLQIKGVRVNFLTTHLGLSGIERLRQAKKIIQFGAQLGDPLILAGDFNENEYGPGVSLLKKYWVKHSQTPCLGTVRSRKNIIGPEIDMIFTTPNLIVKDLKIFNNYLSDHLPVMADLELKTSWTKIAGANVFL